MRWCHIKYLGYAISVVAGLLIATDTGPKVAVSAIVIVGATLILVGDRSGPDARS